MGLIGFIFACFGIWLLVTLIRVGWRIYSTFNKVNNAFRSASGTQERRSENNERESWFARNWKRATKPVRRKKIIPEDYGEYVDFTETPLTPEDKARQASEDTSTDRFSHSESQIEDAEWEDVR